MAQQGHHTDIIEQRSVKCLLKRDEHMLTGTKMRRHLKPCRYQADLPHESAMMSVVLLMCMSSATQQVSQNIMCIVLVICTMAKTKQKHCQNKSTFRPCGPVLTRLLSSHGINDQHQKYELCTVTIRTQDRLQHCGFGTSSCLLTCFCHVKVLGCCLDLIR